MKELFITSEKLVNNTVRKIRSKKLWAKRVFFYLQSIKDEVLTKKDEVEGNKMIFNKHVSMTQWGLETNEAETYSSQKQMRQKWTDSQSFLGSYFFPHLKISQPSWILLIFLPDLNCLYLCPVMDMKNSLLEM